LNLLRCQHRKGDERNLVNASHKKQAHGLLQDQARQDHRKLRINFAERDWRGTACDLTYKQNKTILTCNRNSGRVTSFQRTVKARPEGKNKRNDRRKTPPFNPLARTRQKHQPVLRKVAHQVHLRHSQNTCISNTFRATGHSRPLVFGGGRLNAQLLAAKLARNGGRSAAKLFNTNRTRRVEN